MHRRKFLKNSALTSAAVLGTAPLISCAETGTKTSQKINPNRPVTICTWDFGNATEKAWSVLNTAGTALDAAEQGVMVEEADPENQTVGLGGRPDRDGIVTLDACIMDSKSNCGAVMGLEGYVHAVSVARRVMEETPMLFWQATGLPNLQQNRGFPGRICLPNALGRNGWSGKKRLNTRQ